MSVLTVDDLRRRSERRPGDLCWHWLGAKTTDGSPRIWTLDYERMEKMTLSGPKAVWNIAHGEGPRGRFVFRACVCTDCVNPAHMRLASTRAEMGAHIRLNGARKGTHVAQRAENIRKAWAVSGLVPTAPEVVIAVRADNGRLADIAARHGISANVASRIRLGQSHKNVKPIGPAPVVKA